MKKVKEIICQIINPSTIIWVDVLYGTGINDLVKYKGKVMLPKNKYFKEMLHNNFENKGTKVVLEDKGGGQSYVSDCKTPLHEMIRISLEKKINIKINYISVLKACTV